MRYRRLTKIRKGVMDYGSKSGKERQNTKIRTNNNQRLSIR